ncbi:hypothetical protein [Microbulbifer sp. SAOS-129_SWC]|uniref:hypothetical protein n=1 Tax=Microbulbifer sp. SAOS-129_SWC TaxID=3145235 RepID=UPI003217403B
MQSWPVLRRDLQFHRAEDSPGDSPGWMLYDPLRAIYIELGALELLILQHWPLGSAEAIASAISRERGSDVSAEQVQQFVQFAADNELLQSSGAQLQQRIDARPRAPLRSVQRLVFWRQPLFSPDRLARWLLPLARLTGRRYFWVGAAALALLAMISMAQHWVDYLSYLRASWSPAGIGAYVGSYFLLSLFHELGHASVARSYGVRANCVGIGLIALMPIMYSEITDGWRLPRRARLHISSAGVIYEFLIGVVAALAWCALEDGTLRSATFYLFTGSLITTLAINLNPLMRFDGYYLLGDIVREKNLHASAAAQLRAAVWHALLRDPGIRAPRDRREWLLIAFALFSVTYRLGVFMGISWMAYQLLFKAAGVLVFAFCITALLLLPTLREYRLLKRHLRERQKANAEANTAADGEAVKKRRDLFGQLRPLPIAMALVLLTLLLVPLPWPVELPASTYYARKQQVVAPQGGPIESIAAQAGDRVAAGTPLLLIDSSELDYRIKRNKLELALLNERQDSDGFAAALDALDGVYLQDLLSKRQQLRALQSQKNQLQVAAEFSGVVDWRRRGIGIGEYLPLNEPVLSIVDPQSLRGRAYGRAQFIERLGGHPHGHLFLPGRWQPITVTIDQVDLIGSRQLPDPALSRHYGGPLATLPDQPDQFTEALHRIDFSLDGSPPLADQRTGYLVVFGKPVSLLKLFARRVVGVFVRESGV